LSQEAQLHSQVAISEIDAEYSVEQVAAAVACVTEHN